MKTQMTFNTRMKSLMTQLLVLGALIAAGAFYVGCNALGSGTGQQCLAGDNCNFACPSGNCDATCESGSTCQVSCAGGNCESTCLGDATCDFSCAGGNCDFLCAATANCTTSCAGNNCNTGLPGSNTGGTSNGGTSNGNTSNGNTSNGNTSNGNTSNGNTSNGGVAVCNPDFDASDACGGDIEGTWTFVDACPATEFVNQVEDQLNQVCPGVTVSADTNASGSVTFAGGVASRSISGEATVTAALPTVCVGLIGGCSGAEALIRSEIDNDLTVKCTDAGLTCDCAITDSESSFNQGAYTIRDNTVNIDGRSWAYCAQGGVLTGRELGENTSEGAFIQVYSR